MPDTRSTKCQIASSVAAPTPLVPYFPRLFDGIDALGSSPRWVVNTLARVAPPSPRSRTLDIAGGKGAVAVALARRFSCRVELSDACDAFVRAATKLAEHHAVAALVSARLADASRELARARRDPADLALMLNLWPFDRAAPALRSAVKPGGVYVFDDAVALGRVGGKSTFPTTAEVEALIASMGDRVLARSIRRRDALERAHAKLLARLTTNARALGRQRPALRPHLAEFLGHHRAAGGLLKGPLRPVLWVVRRGG